MKATKVLSLLLTAAMLLAVLPLGVWAESTVSDFEYTITDGKVTITGYNGEGGDVVIPNEIEGYPVTSIGTYAFQYCDIISIVLPNGLTSIGEYAFDYCNVLKKIVIPDSVTHIGEGAFVDCDSLENIVIPDSVMYIDSYAFYHTNLKYILCLADAMPSNWSSDWNRECNAVVLWGVISSQEYPNLVFYRQDNGLEVANYIGNEGDVVVPDTVDGYPVTSIINNAFSNCVSLTSIVIPDSVTSIGEYAFSNCYSLTSITIPVSVTSIGDSVFSNCWSLTNIVIPDGVTSIGDYAFANCYTLTSIVIPEGVTSIGRGAFSCCYYMTGITLPVSVTSIGDSVFSDCWSLTNIVIPVSVTSIGDFVFSNCWSLTNIVIPVSVTSIGNYVFSSCRSLTNIVIPDSVTSIGEHAFYNCEALTSIAIPESVTSVGGYAFHSCAAMTDIYCGAESIPEDWNILWRGYCTATVHWGACAHTQTETYTVSATCTTDGYKITECLDCGEEISRKVFPAVNHNYQNGVCKTCGESIADPIGAEITVSGNVASAGDTVTVDIVLDNTVGFAYLNLLLDYDTDALELVSVANGVLIEQFAQDICMVWANESNVTETGVLATLVFAVREDAQAGDYSVTVRCIECCDEKEQDVYVSVTGGTVCVVDVIAGDVTGDDVINGKDAVRLLQYLANYNPMTGSSTVEIGAGADCNGDGVINSKDVTRLLRYLASYNPVTGESSVVLGPGA